MPDGAGAATPAASKSDDSEPAERTEPQAGLEQHDRDLPESGVESSSGAREEHDPRLASKATTSIDVEIFGSVYHVRGEQDQDYLRRLAAVVDDKMREISRHVPVVDSGKIAILAALNLADELLQCNHQQEGERVEMMEKVEELTGLLTEALDD